MRANKPRGQQKTVDLGGRDAQGTDACKIQGLVGMARRAFGVERRERQKKSDKKWNWSLFLPNSESSSIFAERVNKPSFERHLGQLTALRIAAVTVKY
jgi:hypothetical protein